MAELWLPAEERLALWEPTGDQLRIIGWRPGPAGVSSLELAPGLIVVLDHASPTTLAEIAVDLDGGRLDPRHVPYLVLLLGEEATDVLHRLAGSRRAATRPQAIGGSDRPSELERERLGRRPDSSVARFARLALAVDIADAGDRSEAARAVAALEAAAGAADLGLDQLVAGLASHGTDLLEDTPPLGDVKLAYQVTALAHQVLPELDPDRQARLRRATERLTSPGERDERRFAQRHRRTSAPAAAAMPVDEPLMTALEASSALEGAGAIRRDHRRQAALPVEGEHRGWAGLTDSSNVVVTAGPAAEGGWARVFRRSDNLLLGLAPVRTAEGGGGGGGGTAATIVVPPTPASDLVVDLVIDPATPRRDPRHEAVRAAVAAGRHAALLTRRRDPAARRAWNAVASQWEGLGDAQRTNLARREGRRDDRRTRATSAPPGDVPALLSDELD